MTPSPRSLTPTPQDSSAAPTPRPSSLPQDSSMAVVVSAPPTFYRPDSEVMNTIPDPRTPSPGSDTTTKGYFTQSSHPELSDEVATLSTKLINAINHQTDLDDSLQTTRHQLDIAREKILQLKTTSMEHESMVKRGLLVRKEEYDSMEQRLQGELAEERRQRAATEKEKRRIESELENLTTALFEEANAMVAAARKEKEAMERKNEQLRNQLRDTELLLASHQEQLQDLKAVMQQMSSDRDEGTNTLNSTTPSTPGVGAPDKMSRIFEAANLSPNASGIDEFPPDHPLHFSHLIHPVLRTDLTPYREFQEMLRSARTSAPSSRAASGNYNGLNVMAIASLAHSRTPPSNGSTTSLPSQTNASTPGSNAGSGREINLPPLKENPFYKRALAEDIEPTLRLDLAPGLSWLARRTVLNSMTVGSLVVEPHPPTRKGYGPVYACSLCGENRKGEPYTRKYRFRTSEADDAQRYPLCDFCLGRVRSTCDYISFLRMVRDGHWRGETEDDQKSAWEEGVRLRERMFWSRIGGGVVPAFVPFRDSPRSLTFDDQRSRPEKVGKSTESKTGELSGQPDGAHLKTIEDPFHCTGNEKRVSIGNTVLIPKAPAVDETGVQTSMDGQETEKELQQSERGQEQSQEDMRKTLVSQGSDTDSSTTKVGDYSPVTLDYLKKEHDSAQGLSATIPGSFE